eukprot:3639193-Karenia_brevis.AAC.1
MYMFPQALAQRMGKNQWMLQALSVVRIEDVQEPPACAEKQLLALKGVDVANPISCWNQTRSRAPMTLPKNSS